jgi:hypothetical protein
MPRSFAAGCFTRSFCRGLENGKIFKAIEKVITKYEGQVEKFIGDAVMAVFGIPRSHEDDPLRTM